LFAAGSGSEPARCRHGFNARRYAEPDGKALPYILFVPYQKPASGQWPVILFLNGAGENGSDGLMNIGQNFGLPLWEVKRGFPFVAVAPQCPSGHKWGAKSDEVRMALAILDQVVDELDADRDRIYLTGVSSGGAAVWEIAAMYPDRFAAAVPLCAPGSRMGASTIARSISRAHLPVWSFFNGLDNLPGVVPFNRAVKEKLIECGNSPIVTEYPAYYHNCWDRAYRTPALFQWLLERKRSSNRAQNDFQPVHWRQPARVRRGKAKADGWRIVNQAVNWEPPSDSNETSIMLADVAPLYYELHLECKESGRAPCEVALAVQDTHSGPSSGWKLVLCSAEGGAGCVCSLDGHVWIADCEPLAQRAWVADSWNDVRILKGPLELTISINGWKAIRSGDPRLRNAPGAAGLIAIKQSTPSLAVRFPRLRIIADQQTRSTP
jgi:pimeloyl-ACP methyl ester carboxylesterase